MDILKKIFHFNLVFLLIGFLLIGCSNKNENGKGIYEQVVHSKDKVYLKVNLDNVKKFNNLKYSWSQLSGIKVDIKDSNKSIAHFIAPDVKQEEILKFKLEVNWGSSEFKNFYVNVKVLPIKEKGDGNNSGGGGINQDTTPPTIIDISKINKNIITNKLTILKYKLDDNESGIDNDSLVVKINNLDFNGRSKIENSILTITPMASKPLPANKIVVKITISDKANNKISKIFNYIGEYDKIAPTINMVSPEPSSVVTNKDELLKFSIKDDINGTGVDRISAKILFNDLNKTFPLVYDNNSSNYIYNPKNSMLLPYGTVNFTILAKDKANNKASEKFFIYLKEKKSLYAYPKASATTAYAPATIIFSPKVTTDNAIQRYSWDFNGDGVFEGSDITANSYTWKYNEPGDYNVTLSVVDVNNNEMNGSVIIHILNKPPKIKVESTPSNGEIPLLVKFVVNAEDSDGIALYEWDFDGDGVYDYNTTSNTAEYNYTKIGTYQANLKVTDSKGTVATYSAPTTTVIASPKGSPTVEAKASKYSGNAPLNVNLSATVNDPQNRGFKSYEWDFDGDGVYDYNSTTTPDINYTYTKAGKYYPKIRVTTNDGRTTSDAIEVTIDLNIILSIDEKTNTIDTFNGESSNISIKNSATVDMRVIVEDRDYTKIRVLDDWKSQKAGEHNFTWDGTDDKGKVVKEGDYYVVVEYKLNGKTKRVDLRETTGGNRYNPQRDENPKSFAPFDNRPMKITFNITKPSEVVSFIGYDYVDTRVVTLRSRDVLGKGSYQDIWYSTNEEGQFISPPPGKWFLYGIWAFELAHNVVYVKSGSHISKLTSTPPIYTPISHDENGEQKKLKINFKLNKDATIELEVYDAQKGVLAATRTFKNVKSGEATIEFDGKDNYGVYLHPGKYTIGLKAVDKSGYRSITQYCVTRIDY